MPRLHSWGWYPPQTTSYIHIRHIQSVWAIGMLSQWYMGAALYSYAGQAGPRFGKPASLEEWKWCYLKSCLRLIFTSDHFIFHKKAHSKCLSHWYAFSKAYGCTLLQLHRPSCLQIWGFRFTWGVEMVPQRHGWGWHSPQTTSHIHIRHIQSVWAIGMLSQGHMFATFYSYTGQVDPGFGDSGSLKKWKWWHNVMVETYIHLRLLHTYILDV